MYTENEIREELEAIYVEMRGVDTVHAVRRRDIIRVLIDRQEAVLRRETVFDDLNPGYGRSNSA